MPELIRLDCTGTTNSHASRRKAPNDGRYSGSVVCLRLHAHFSVSTICLSPLEREDPHLVCSSSPTERIANTRPAYRLLRDLWVCNPTANTTIGLASLGRGAEAELRTQARAFQVPGSSKTLIGD